MGKRNKVHSYSYLKCSHGNLTGDGVSPEGGPVFPRLDGQHYLIIAQHCRYLRERQKHVTPKVRSKRFMSLATQKLCELWQKKVLNRVSSSRESFAKQHYIRADSLVVHSQPPARPPQSRLHLIGNPENLDKTNVFSPNLPTGPISLLWLHHFSCQQHGCNSTIGHSKTSWDPSIQRSITILCSPSSSLSFSCLCHLTSTLVFITGTLLSIEARV